MVQLEGWIRDRKIQLIFTIVVQVLIYNYLSEGRFVSGFNLLSMAYQLPEATIFAFSMMIVILTGGINLALITTGTMATIVGVALISKFPNLNPVLVLVFFSLVVGVLIGLGHGILVAYFSVPPIVLTLASSYLFLGVGLNITKGGSLSNLPPSFLVLSNESLLGLPISLWLTLLVAFGLWLYLEKTVQGRQIYMMGSNVKTSFFSGLPVIKLFIIVYLISAFLGVLASFVMISRYNSAKIDYGFTYLLQSVAVVVLAGFDINGGKGNIVNILLATINFQLLSSGFNIIGLDRFFYIFVLGLLLLTITLIDAAIHNKMLFQLYKKS